jgi:UDP-2-acetamido-3-amino-2,3-dideoxy-glucuronate N-acetyltransferase
VAQLIPHMSESVFIHPTAVVDRPTHIGRGTQIWHFCHVMKGASIGERCVLGQNGFVASGVVVGNGCRLQNNVSLFEGVELEAEVFVGPSAVFTNVTNPRAAIARRDKFLRTHLCRGTTVGANATILPGITLGRWCFIAAGAVVRRDVPAFALMAGVPARRVGWMSWRGERLEFDPTTKQATCPEGGEVYELDNLGGVRLVGDDPPLAT